VTDVPRLHLTRRQLLARLPEPGAPGWTSYRPPGAPPSFDESLLGADVTERFSELAASSETGSALFLRTDDATLILPPFPVEEAADFSELHPAALIELLRRRRSVAVLLLRLGGFTVGFLRGETVIDAKTDQRFVKNRHRKGGQSQRRFDRIREKQVRELFDEACEASNTKLTPFEAEIQHVFLGGDRHTLLDFRKRCSYFERFGERLMRRVLPVAGDPRRAALDAAPREIWSSEIYVATPSPPGV
jgi:hypothetical protein